MNRIGIGIEAVVAPEALVKPGKVGVLDVGSSIGCGTGGVQKAGLPNTLPAQGA